MVERVDIRDYIKLYENGYRLDQIKPLTNQTYQIFKNCGVDIRIVHRSAVYENAMAFTKIRYFIRDNEYFYMIPVTTVKETIVGFILRGVTRSDYSTVSREFNDAKFRVPLMFGFSKSFELLDEKDYCYPIIVCEGSKDCLFLKQFYPFVVANNTSSMGLNAYVLVNLSNKFILAYDNDSAGQEGIEKDKKVLRSLGAQVVSLDLCKEVKDCADYTKFPEKLNSLKEEIRYKMKRVNSF